jgi:hypothetical protein
MSNVVVVGAGLAGPAAARRLVALVAELGLSTFRTWNDEGRLLLDLQGRRSTMKPHKGAVPRISPFAVADLAQGLLRFARLAKRTDLRRPWLTPDAELLDGQTWESWIRRNLRTKAGLETLVAVDRGAQRNRVAGGSVRVAAGNGPRRCTRHALAGACPGPCPDGRGPHDEFRRIRPACLTAVVALCTVPSPADVILKLR